MSDRETLLSTLPESLHSDASKLLESSQDQDPHDVIAELHRRGLLDADGVKSAVLELQDALRVGRMRSEPPPEQAPSILGPLGAGAMGEVLLAKDEGLGRVVAVKRLLPALARRKAVVERFYREAQITAQLDHPSIVPIHGLNTEGGGLSYSMKLVRGKTFEEYLEEVREEWRKSGRETGEHLLHTRIERFLHVVDAIAYAHDRGVIHRDLKPENIMVGAFGQIQVMDWGIAKILSRPEEDKPSELPAQSSPPSPSATRAGSVFGTPRYMSPEQAAGRTDIIGPASDQYALGLILFEIVSLRPAVTGMDVESCLAWARDAKKQPLTHAFQGSVPRELAAIVEKATSKEIPRRYASVAALGEDIRRYLRDESVQASPDSLPQRLLRWVGHHRSTTVALVMLLVMIFSVSFVALASSSLLILEWRRRAAAEHEDTVSAMQALASKEAAEVDALLRQTEQSLTGLSYAIAAALDRPEGDERPEFKFDPLEEGPAMRAKKSGLYGRPVSVDRLTLSGARPSKGDLAVARLFSTPYPFQRALHDAGGQKGPLDRGTSFELIATGEGVPVRWVKFAMQSGFLATLPGTETRFGPPDATRLPWYRDETSGSILWRAPAKDPAGMGLVLAVTRPVIDHEGNLLGTAALDLGAHAVVGLLQPPKGFREVWIVDGGRVLLWSGMKTDGSETSRAIPDPKLAEELSEEPSGFYEEGSSAAAWATLGNGWRIVLWSGDDAWREVKTGRRSY